MELTETSFTMGRDLQSCEYSFKIEAFNSQGIQIAENDGWRNFANGGIPQKCILTASAPQDGASVTASNITLTWQPHDWAAEYQIHMYSEDDSSQKVLDFVKTNTTSYTITQNVPAGRYIWVVYAYDDYGDGLGFSDQSILNVTSP
jgi:hypothetical protein